MRLILLTVLSLIFSMGITAQPNFVVIMSDDMGWTGTSVRMDSSRSDSKSGYYYTPNIDTCIAQKGMTFTKGYASAPKCAPTRCSILTGRSTARNHFTETGSGLSSDKLLVAPATDRIINTADTTLAEWLKITNLDYTTAHFGKWHLGADGTSSHGFDEGDGATTNNDGENGGGAQTDPKNIDDLTSKSISFINASNTANKPFYLQISHYSVHSSVEYRQSTRDKYDDLSLRPADPNGVHTSQEYAAMTEDLDEVVGQVVKEIENLGIDDETYIVFVSDNGAGGQSDNFPLTRGKSFLNEGGIRVPFMIRGPNIPASTYNDTPVVTYDLFPTFAALTGSSTALPSNLDGVDISNLFTSATFNRTEPLYFHVPHYSTNSAKVPRSVAIDNNYKLIINYETGVDELYNINNDIEEALDSASLLPELTLELKVKLRDHLSEVEARLPTLDESHANFNGNGDDVDQDGLSDLWEFSQLLSYHYGPGDDPDGDGENNLSEANAGTDPLVQNNIYLLCQSTYGLDNQTVTTDNYVSAQTELTSARAYTGLTEVEYTAGSAINLNAGFTIDLGVSFTAEIKACE